MSIICSNNIPAGNLPACVQVDTWHTKMERVLLKAFKAKKADLVDKLLESCKLKGYGVNLNGDSAGAMWFDVYLIREARVIDGKVFI